VNRPNLATLFKGINTKTQREKANYNAHMKYGYTLKEIADHLKIHYTTVSKVITKEMENEK
jgi:DNA-binding MarR family transcriptional regulator